MIGLSLAALVAGSLITLAVLAQRVSLEGPFSNAIEPHRMQQQSEPAPLVVGNEPSRQPRERIEPPPVVDGEVTDRVLPLRIRREPALPSSGRKQEPKKQQPRRRPGPGRPLPGMAPALPPGLAKKAQGARPEERRATRAPAGGKPNAAPPQPQAKSHGPAKSRPTRSHGGCGEPPCGKALGHQKGVGHQKARGNGHHKDKHKHH